MARRRQLRRFRTHVWHVVSVTTEVEAEEQAEAIDVALQQHNYYELFLDVHGLSTAYTEDIIGACVDVTGDKTYGLTQYYESRTNVLYDPVRQLLDNLDDEEARQQHVEQLRELLRNFV